MLRLGFDRRSQVSGALALAAIQPHPWGAFVPVRPLSPMSLPRTLRLSFLLAAAAAGGAAADPGAPRLPRSSPEAQGVSAAGILRYVDAADATVNSMHSFILVRHGQVVAEGWWAPYGRGEPHLMFSLSKSFTSTAVGLAQAEGKLSIYDPLDKIFADCVPAAASKNQQAMRLRDLLRMSSGQTYEAITPFPFASKEDLAKTFLALPVQFKPGTHFVYNTPATYMASAAVQRVTGQSVHDYLMPRLFAPLGIDNPSWDASAQGISFGGFGLSLRTEDIASFGQLLLQRGQWQNRQLVPAAWIDEATALQTSNGGDPALALPAQGRLPRRRGLWTTLRGHAAL
jgi:CubicO group peptidase (beta-lactamase class C family)